MTMPSPCIEAAMRGDSKVGAELLFDVISTAYERTSLIVTTTLPFESWTEVLGSERPTGAGASRPRARATASPTPRPGHAGRSPPHLWTMPRPHNHQHQTSSQSRRPQRDWESAKRALLH